MRAWTILLAAGFCIAAFPSRAADTDHDSRVLRAAEQTVFFPLVCKKRIHRKDNNCAGVIGLPGYAGDGATSLTLDAVAYGAFTRPGADQAYVTYDASFEPHADNFGGGILFERRGGQWHLVHWYPGGQMETCVALPPEATQRMLCLSGYTGMGETDSSVWIDRVVPGDKLSSAAVLKAQDDREVGDGADTAECSRRNSPKDAVLLSIDDLKRSNAPGVLAVAKITYVTARDANAACRAGRFENAKETNGVVRFHFAHGKAVAQTPANFARTDY
ncbi:MAG TPA: hypothetical protein VG867_06505 [Rhizomicrobium sp.]|nr:hypothetical protein [Rhizomicrobium sp.]